VLSTKMMPLSEATNYLTVVLVENLFRRKLQPPRVHCCTILPTVPCRAPLNLSVLLQSTVYRRNLFVNVVTVYLTTLSIYQTIQRQFFDD
jgi:hypothetical protein